MEILLVLSLVIAAGVSFGKLRFFGMSLGVASVLFFGLLVGHFNIPLNRDILVFTRDLGLVLFVYTIGIQVGPGFFASFRKEGLRLNLAAITIVLLGVLVTLGLYQFFHLPAPIAVGLLSGAVTNTPSMAAAQQAWMNRLDAGSQAIEAVGFGYAIAYPFGVLGTIVVMVVLRRLFRIPLSSDAQQYQAVQKQATRAPNTLNVEVENPQLAGQPLSILSSLIQPTVIVSRLLRNEQVSIPRSDTKLQMGDVLHAVGAQQALEKLRLAVGDPTPIDPRTVSSNLTNRYVLVTQAEVLGRSLGELQFENRYGVAITRIARAGTEFVPNAAVRLQFGDRLTVVGEDASIKKVAINLGDSPKALDAPNILPIFLGIALGVLLGNLPITLPGTSSPLRLGLAGGPLMIAMLLSRIGRIGSVIWYLPQSANLFLREMGIALFLSCVGLSAGDRLLPMLTRVDGWILVGCGALITVLPLLVVGFVARHFFKMNYGVLCGLLSGSMTDPPALAFASSIHPTQAPIITYTAVYPLALCLRVVFAQLLAIMLR
ncbi:MAG: putative transporter [Candidatus Omnitrophica bacterium]|nr:putative transporter [Candidatus Omnitrophota bacterium]